MHDEYKADKKRIYRYLASKYDDLLEEIIFLADCYDINNALEISCFYNVLLHNVMAPKMEVLDPSSYIFDPSDIMGINTVLNGGVCRHHVSMLNDIYHKYQIDSMILVGILYDSLEEVSNLHLNHVILLAGDNNKLFIDPSNTMYFQKSKTLDNTVFNCEKSFWIIPPNYVKELDYFNKYDDINYDTYCRLTSLPDVSNEEILKAKKEVIDILKSSSSYLKKFVKYNELITKDVKDQFNLMKTLEKKYNLD